MLTDKLVITPTEILNFMKGSGNGDSTLYDVIRKLQVEEKKLQKEIEALNKLYPDVNKAYNELNKEGKTQGKIIKELTKVLGDNSEKTKHIIKTIDKANKSLTEREINAEKAKVDIEVHNATEKSLVERMKDSYQKIASSSPYLIGSTKLLVTAGFTPIATATASILTNLSKIQATSEETGFFADKLTDRFQSMAESAQQLVLSGARQSQYIGNVFQLSVKLQNTMGNIDIATMETLENIGYLPRVIGMSTDEATTFLTTLRGITGESVNLNTKLIQTIAVLGNINNVAPKTIMEDISNNADFFAKYMSNANTEMIKSVITARRLGIETGTYVKMLEGLNTVESIIEKQMQISMFIGRQIDLVGVATKQFQGDTVGAMKEINKQLRLIGQEQFNQPFIKGILAEQLGLSNQELVTMYNNVHNIGNETDRINMSYQNALSTFNENFSARGLATFKHNVEMYILNPLNDFFSTGTKEAQGFIDTVSGIIRLAGKLMMGVLSTVALFNKTVDRMFGENKVGSFIKAFSAGIGTLLVTFKLLTLGTSKQISLLQEIRNILQMQSVNPATGGRGWANMSGGRRAGAVGMGALGLLGSGVIAYNIGRSESDGATGSGLLSSMGQGALTGGLIGSSILPVKGTAIGAVGGAIAGGLAYGIGVNQMNQGGIIINKPTRIGNTVLGDGQNGTQSEAVIPLSSKRGKEVMQMDLSDDSIQKLVRGMKEMEIPIQIFLKNNTDKEQEYYDILARPSSSVAFSR